jgi:hypothetical protein
LHLITAEQAQDLGLLLRRRPEARSTRLRARLNGPDCLAQHPRFIASDGSNITLDHFVFRVGGGSPYDLGFTNIKGYHLGWGTVSNTETPPRIQETDSTAN